MLQGTEVLTGGTGTSEARAIYAAPMTTNLTLTATRGTGWTDTGTTTMSAAKIATQGTLAQEGMETDRPRTRATPLTPSVNAPRTDPATRVMTARTYVTTGYTGVGTGTEVQAHTANEEAMHTTAKTTDGVGIGYTTGYRNRHAIVGWTTTTRIVGRPGIHTHRRTHCAPLRDHRYGTGSAYPTELISGHVIARRTANAIVTRPTL